MHFSLSSEGLTIRPSRMMLSLVSFMGLLASTFWVCWQPNGQAYCKASSELPSYGLMIVSHHRFAGRRGRQRQRPLQEMAATSRRRDTSCSPEFGKTRDLPVQDESTTLTAVNQPRSPGVWTIVNLPKELTKVKTYSDMLVLWQDSDDKFGEPHRWALYVWYFDKSSFPAVHRTRLDAWNSAYSVSITPTSRKPSVS